MSSKSLGAALFASGVLPERDVGASNFSAGGGAGPIRMPVNLGGTGQSERRNGERPILKESPAAK